MKLTVTTILCWMCRVTAHATEAGERSLSSSNQNAIQKINYDVGFVPYIAIVLGVLVLASGIKVIVTARASISSSLRWMVMHVYVILIVAATGVFVHSTGLYAIYSAASVTGQVDPAQVAGDKQFLTQYDIWFSVIIMGGALLGAIAILTKPSAEQVVGLDAG